jgi:CheY-like chemotaxis protein
MHEISVGEIARRATNSKSSFEKPLEGVRILLAEDGRDNQRLISFHLKRAGAVVTIAENGRQAFDLLTMRNVNQETLALPSPFDLLLTDMQMPEMDGYSLARSLRAMGSTLPIIALTAHAMADDAKKCLDAGCDEHATKPIVAPQLIDVCRRWVDIRKEHSAL